VRARPAAAKAPSDRLELVRRLLLVLALIPLLLSMFTQDEDVETRLERMIRKDPKLGETIRQAAEGDDAEAIFRALPRERIEGAVHGRFTWVHWAYALLSAMIFWLFILVAYPMGTATSTQLWTLGIFTGTVGILMLLGIQWIALHMGGWVVPRSIVGIIFIVVRFIGFSYESAMDPSNGFLLSLFGFTFGVGLCEELCKTLPLLWLVRRNSTLDVRGIVLLGLATGIGFGVSEGISYSSSWYNGVSGVGIYVVRFVSCVALHAVWSACSGLLLWGMQSEIDDIGEWYGWFLPILKVLGISMLLHGLYDTFLKRGLEGLAMLTAVASLAWFFWLYERTCRTESSAVPA